jgi:hypothetical protein
MAEADQALAELKGRDRLGRACHDGVDGDEQPVDRCGVAVAVTHRSIIEQLCV